MAHAPVSQPPQGARFGVVSMCIGSGMGAAAVFEQVPAWGAPAARAAAVLAAGRWGSLCRLGQGFRGPLLEELADVCVCKPLTRLVHMPCCVTFSEQNGQGG